MFVARVTADVDALQQFIEWGGIAWIISVVPGHRRARADARVTRGSSRSRWSLLVIPMVRDHGLDAGPAVGRVQHRADPRRRDALGGQRVRDGRRGRSRIRARRRGPRAGGAGGSSARYKAEVRGALPRRDAVAAVDRLLRASSLAIDRSRSGRCSACRGGSRSGRPRRSCSWPTSSCRSFSDMPEIYSETQTAIAGWRKILAVLDLPIEVAEPTEGVALPPGALGGAAPTTSATATGPGPRCCTASRSRCRRAPTWRSWARPAAASPRS